MKRLDLTGMRFGRLTLKSASNIGAKSAWLCACDCGAEKLIRTAALRSGATISCGCKAREGGSTTHGMTRGGKQPPEYRVWASMLARCGNPNGKSFVHYGGRGIFVCERWQKFANFYDDMGPRPFANASIERVDNDKGYFKANCVWATSKRQARNRRGNVIVAFEGEEITLAEVVERLGQPYSTVHTRYCRGLDLRTGRSA